MPPCKTKYMIPGFEACDYADGKPTDLARARLSQQDAIALIINDLCLYGPSFFGIENPKPDAALADIRVRLNRWRGKNDHTGYCGVGWYASAYFNTNPSYGHVGKDIHSTHTTTTKYSSFHKQDYNQDVPTYWYRTRHGHYALTHYGHERVALLKQIMSKVLKAAEEAVSATRTRVEQKQGDTTHWMVPTQRGGCTDPSGPPPRTQAFSVQFYFTEDEVLDDASDDVLLERLVLAMRAEYRRVGKLPYEPCTKVSVVCTP